jgi:hypothetical protein
MERAGFLCSNSSMDELRTSLGSLRVGFDLCGNEQEPIGKTCQARGCEFVPQEATSRSGISMRITPGKQDNARRMIHRKGLDHSPQQTTREKCCTKRLISRRSHMRHHPPPGGFLFLEVAG